MVMTVKRKQTVCQFGSTEKVKMTKIFKPREELQQNYASKIDVFSKAEKELQAKKMSKNTTKLTGEQERMLLSQPQPILTTMAHIWDSFTHWNKDGIKISRNRRWKGIREEIERTSVQELFEKEWFLLHYPLLNLNNPNKIRPVCKAATK